MIGHKSKTHSATFSTEFGDCFTNILWVLWYAPQKTTSKNSSVVDYCVKRYLIGARYYDGDLGLWTSVDAMRQFWSPYGYVGNGWNPVTAVDADGNYVLGKTGSGDKTRYAIHTRSRAGVAAGQIIKTGAVVTTMFFHWGVGVAWGLVTGVIEAGGDGAQKGAITGTATSVMSEGFDSGKLVGKVGGTFLTAAGEIIAWDETMSQADSPEFIEEFERRMIGNGGDTYNSFITEQEATDFANEIRKTIGEDEQ